jgi:vacuolar-type H+-ATPase subunit C/Vma6
MKSPKIIYLITRTHGLKKHLLKTDDFLRILRAKNIVEIFDLMINSEYSAELRKTPMKELDAYSLEKAFYLKLSERFSFLLQITNGKIREVLEDYYKIIEIENLKRTIRALHGKERIKEDQLIPIPRRYQTVNFQALLKSQTVREIVELLKETPYRDLADKVYLYEKYNNLLVLEMQAEKIYYEILWEKLDEIVDKKEIKELVGTEIDLKNLLYILSFKRLGMEPEPLQEMIIDVYHKLLKSLIPQLTRASFEAIPKILTWPTYIKLTEKAVDLLDRGMLTQAEKIFWTYLYSYAEKNSSRKPNNLVYVFAYLYICFREARNLTTIVLGKQLKMSEEQIESSLFL